MWHTTEIIRIFKRITIDYGYDIFSDRKKCVGLCGDLLSYYEAERKVMQMLFQAGLGEALVGVPFKTEQELRMGIHRIESFLKKQAIEQYAREQVVEIIKSSLAEPGITVVGGAFQPTITRSFSDVHFKMTIPEIKEFADRYQFAFRFMGKREGEHVDSILEKCVITDRVNVVHASQMDYSLLLYGKTVNTAISVPYGNRRIFLTDARIEFVYLCSNKRKIIVSYMADKSRKLSFKQIEIHGMTSDEYEKMQSISQMLIKAGEEATAGEAASAKKDGTGQFEGVNVAPAYTSSDILEYSDALRKEILFLKQGKGKKYKIVNGTKINKDKGVFTYTFEMETELHLPDDAPVVVDTSTGFHAVGTVLLCEDFQIMLLLDRDLNDKVSSAYLMVEPWKLLEGLDKRMTSLNPNVNRLAVKLMEDGPKLSTTQDIASVPKGQDEVINKLLQDDIVTVWGPPGTGKTYTMAKIAKEYITKGKSVLIVSHSNVSVDGVIKQVVGMIDTDMQTYLETGKILRFGFVRDDDLSKHPYATSFNYALSKSPSLAKDLDSLTNKRDELRAKNQMKTPAYDEIEKRIKKVREEIRKEERRYVEKAQLIGTTISRATIDPMFEERQFDLVMFDEVSMAYVPQVIVGAALAREKFLCVGDFRQLSPIAQGLDSKKVLQSDIFAYLQIVDEIGNMYWHPWLVMLNEQRRMHHAISEFPNKFVYKNLLKNHPTVSHNRDHIVAKNPLKGDAVNLIDLAGSYCAASKNSDNSRFNILSAIVSFSTAVAAERDGLKSVGIITPYAAQTRLVRAMIRDYYGFNSPVVNCATVHQFQGSESDVLVFDAVESYPTNKVGFLMGKVPNEVVRLINVAITRAKGKLITVANASFWNNTFKGTNHIFYRLICHMQANHKVISQKNKDLKPYIDSINPGKVINIYPNESQALTDFERDMRRASGKIVISIPDSELRETAFRVLDMIDDAERNGNSILMKANEYEDLPDEWKKYCWGTENAVFPLIVIDDEVAWYGLPTSKLKFKTGKDSSHITVVDTIVRIKGRNTIEMIKALTDLENIHVGNNIRPLVSKKGAAPLPSLAGGNDKGTMGARGMAAFIEEKQFCPECKSHMELARNKKGTYYIRCSNKNCKHMEFLEPQLMNWYINTRNIKCPKRDGGELTGILSKFGPCVRCSRGHFLRPDEV